MNTLKMRIPAAIFTVNVNEITMFDILDTLQKSEDLRGRDFGTIKLEPSNGSLLCFNNETYEPVPDIASEDFSPETTYAFPDFPRVNQFIRNVQLTFPGIGFQFLNVKIWKGRIYIAAQI
jgi:hypothetical protein